MRLGLWIAPSLVLALGGCDFAPRYATPTVSLPANYRDPSAGEETPPGAPWWRSFKDATLDKLETEIDAANPDLAATVAASDAAFARAAEVEAHLLPQVDALGGTSANRQSDHRPLRSASQPTYYGNNLLGAQVSYEVDIWGRVRDLTKSANLTAEASADAVAQARLELHAELARAYVNLRGLDAEARFISDTIGVYRSALDLTKSRLEAKIASPVDVDRAQTQLSSAEAQASEIALRRTALVDAMAALVGRPAPSFSVPPSSGEMRLPARPRAVPADVLRRRPDVAEAERRTAAANQTVGAARANFFPRFSLLALGGTQDTGFRLFNAGNLFATVGPTIDLPLFDAGLRQAELDVAKAQFTEAAEQYRASVLAAVKEVQDSLSALKWLAQEYQQVSTAAAAAKRAADLSMTLYREGAASFLDVVTAQSAALESQRLAINLHTRQLEANIALMLALGGGWVVPPESTPPPPDLTPTPVQLVNDVWDAKQ